MSVPNPHRFGQAFLSALSAASLGRGLQHEAHQAHGCTDHPQGYKQPSS